MKRRLSGFFALVILLILKDASLAQAQEMFLVDSQQEKIVLRWATDDWSDLAGFNVYRRSEGGSWQKLNPQLISRLKSVEEIFRLLGSDEAGLYLGLFGIKGQISELSDEVFLKLAGDKNGRQWLGAFSLLYPKFGQALGLSYEDSKVAAGQKYYYKVTKVSKSSLESDLYATQKGFAVGEVLAIPVPSGLQAKAGENQVFFQWQYDLGFNKENFIVSYNLYRRQEEETAFKKVNPRPIFIIGSKSSEGKLILPEYFYLDQGLTNGKKYFYKLTAVNAVGRESGFSAEIIVEPKDLTPPLPPLDLSAKIEEGKALLSWSANKEADLKGYNIYRSLSAEKDFLKINPALISENKFSDSQIKQNLLYWYRLAAVDNAGNESDYSGAVSVLIEDKNPPLLPYGLKAEAEEGKIILQWSANSEPDLLGYRLYRATAKDGPFLLLTQEPLKTNLYEDILPALSQTTYWYKLRSLDSAYNESEFSAAVSARLPDKLAPRSPSWFKSFSRDSEVSLQWLGNPEKDLLGYNVYRKDAPGGKFNKLNPEVIAKDKREFKDRRLIHQQKFSYYLTALDGSGNESPPSQEISLIGLDETPPQPPAALSAKNTENGLFLSWQKNPEPDLKCYNVFRKEKESFLKVASCLEKEEFLDQNTEDKTTYLYYITALDLSGNQSQPSQELSFQFEKEARPK
jgi:fibronectin type 3 domain-containing protein